MFYNALGKSGYIKWLYGNRGNKISTIKNNIIILFLTSVLLSACGFHDNETDHSPKEIIPLKKEISGFTTKGKTEKNLFNSLGFKLMILIDRFEEI